MKNCNICGKEFKTHQALNAHMISHKKGSRYSESRKGIKMPWSHNDYYECEWCGTLSKKAARKDNKFCTVSCSNMIHKTDDERNEARRKSLRKSTVKYFQKKNNNIPFDADLDKIGDIYDNCPPGYHVDHIIPISRGGKHHQDNLQYLTASENLQKHNKTMEEWEEWKRKKGIN